MVCGRLQRTGGILILYNEEDFLQLSGIQHFEFCRRQWALAYMEMQWQENVRTVEGRILHENAHDAGLKEKRGDLIIVRAMPIHSREMGVSLHLNSFLSPLLYADSLPGNGSERRM